jgi:hypothetical protein
VQFAAATAADSRPSAAASYTHKQSSSLVLPLPGCCGCCSPSCHPCSAERTAKWYTHFTLQPPFSKAHHAAAPVTALCCCMHCFHEAAKVC